MIKKRRIKDEKIMMMKTKRKKMKKKNVRRAWITCHMKRRKKERRKKMKFIKDGAEIEIQRFLVTKAFLCQKCLQRYIFSQNDPGCNK